MNGRQDAEDNAGGDPGARVVEICERLKPWDYREIDVANLEAEMKRLTEDPEYQRLLSDLHREITALCRLFLDASDDRRVQIRQSFLSRRNVLNHLCGYPAVAAQRLQAERDVAWLRIGLAAASIENASTDIRDLILSLEELYRQAVDIGIDPVPHFQEIARISSNEQAEGGFTGSTTRRLLMDFHERM